MKEQNIVEKVKDKVEDKDLQIELLEDITDSINPKEEMVSKSDYDKMEVELDLYKKKYDELQKKYISRFGASDSNTPNRVVDEDKIEDKKEVIDIKSIFDDKGKEE